MSGKAKNTKIKPNQAEKNITKYPSPYGSHAVMVVAEWTEKLDDESFVVCQDDDGFYVTKRERLDTGWRIPTGTLRVNSRLIGWEFVARLEGGGP
jgi:hypothetical protein